MAEEQGFEPWEDFHPRRFSRPVHSTTLPLLRQALHNGAKLIQQEQEFDVIRGGSTLGFSSDDGLGKDKERHDSCFGAGERTEMALLIN